jgi:hypothetical protein
MRLIELSRTMRCMKTIKAQNQNLKLRILAAAGLLMASASHAADGSLPYPQTSSASGYVASQSYSSSQWRAKYCQKGFNLTCFNHLVFKSAANYQVSQNRDLGIKMALGSVNAVVNERLKNSQTELSSGEKKEIKMLLNKIYSEQEKLRNQARGSNLAWDDEQSVKTMFTIFGAIPATQMTSSITKEILARVDETFHPTLQLMAQDKYTAAYMQVEAMGDVFGDLQLNTKRMAGLSAAVDPFLVSWMGITTQQEGAKILENNPLLESLFVAKSNRELMIRIYEEIKDGQVLTEEGLQKILAEFQGEQSDVSAAIAAAPEVSPESVEYKERLEALTNYENSLRLVSSLGSLLPEGALKNFTVKSVALANVATSVYRAFLDPDKLGRMVMTANVVDAASAALRLFFNSGPDANTLILEEIGNLRRDIVALHQSMAEGFNQTFFRLDAIYGRMTEGFDLVLKGQEEHGMLLRNLQLDLDQLKRNLAHLDVSMLNYFEASSRRLSALLNVRCFDQNKFFNSGSLSAQDFMDCGGKFIKEGVEFSRDAIATQVSQADFEALQERPELVKSAQIQTQRRYDLLSVADELSGRDPLSQLNYMGASLQLHAGLSLFPHDGQSLKSVPSVHQWILGANAFMTLVDENYQHKRLLRKSSVEVLLQSGVEIQSFVKKLRGENTRKSLEVVLGNSQKSFLEALKALQLEYNQVSGTENFDSVFWGPMPQQGALKPADYSGSIPASLTGAVSDLPATYPMDKFPELGRLALQLGVAGLEVESQVVGHPTLLYKAIRRVQTSTRTRGGRGPLCGMDCPSTTITSGRLEADVEIQTQFKVGGHLAMTCRFLNPASLWIGDYMTEQHDYEGGARTVREHRRTFGDVIKQVWEDGAYNVRHSMSCRSEAIEATPLLAQTMEAWKLRQKNFKKMLLLLVSKKSLGEGLNAQMRAPMENFVKATRELASVHKLLESLVSVAFVQGGRDAVSIREKFLLGELSLAPPQMAEWLNSNLENASSPVLSFETSFKEQNNKLLQEWTQGSAVMNKSGCTLPELDLMVERLRMRAASL